MTEEPDLMKALKASLDAVRAGRAEVRCRARLVNDCAHGRPENPEEPMPEDGTFDGESVVCWACYVAVMPFTPSGQALNEELPAGIRIYRENAEYARAHPNPELLALDAEAVVGASRAGSPRHVSAAAAAAMARAEVARRAALPLHGMDGGGS